MVIHKSRQMHAQETNRSVQQSFQSEFFVTFLVIDLNSRIDYTHEMYLCF